MNEVENQFVKMESDITSLNETLGELNGLSDQFGRNMVQGFKAAALQGKSFEVVLKRIALNLSGSALNSSLKPLQNIFSGLSKNLLGGLGSILPFAKGGVVNAGGIVPFAKGGVVSSPSFFQAGRKMGVMGEAGAEAILPLARSADGRLGVRLGSHSTQAQAISVTINTPDVAGFKQSEAQVTAALTRAVQRGQRNL